MNNTTFIIDTDDIQKPLLPNSGGTSTIILFRMIMYYGYVFICWLTYLYLVVAVSKYTPFEYYYVNLFFKGFVSIMYIDRVTSLNKKIKQAILEDE